MAARSWSAPIAISPTADEVWVVNPDSASVSVIETGTLNKVVELPVGGEPWSVALAPDGKRAYVVDRAGGRLVVIDRSAYATCTTVYLGPEPAGLALSPDGARAYVTISAADELAVIDLITLTITERIPLAPRPYGIAVGTDGTSEANDEKIFVTHFLAQPRPGGEEARDDGREGIVSIIGAGDQVVKEVVLTSDDQGFPNLLAAVALSDRYAWIPHVRAAPDEPAGLTTTVFAAVAALDRKQAAEAPAARLLLNDQEVFGSPVNNPLAAVPSPDGKRLYVVLGGSDLVEVIDVADPVRPGLVTFLPVGQNPRGIAISSDGSLGYVYNFLSRSITILDLEHLAVVSEVPVSGETLSATILRGKILFNNAVDPRLSKGSWISCASCHPDGGTDGVTWFFPDGPRQTPPLWEATNTLPWHWSAALDEAQDVEVTIEEIQHGLGLAPGADPTLLGAPLAGRSQDLDALADFLASGIRTPSISPASADADVGRRLFSERGCAACHGGLYWTSSTLPGAPGTLDEDGNGVIDAVLRKVGSMNPRDIRGEEGFDPPSLLGVALTAPYFHDGSQPTLATLLESGHPDPAGDAVPLNEEEIGAIVSFLQSIGAQTAPVEEP